MSAAKVWFERTLPALVISRFDDFLSMTGAIAFEVGDEAWTLTFADVESPVREGASEDAGLELRFSPTGFAAFTEGTLDVAQATGSGEISATGELELLQSLARLMVPLQRDLGWDAT